MARKFKPSKATSTSSNSIPITVPIIPSKSLLSFSDDDESDSNPPQLGVNQTFATAYKTKKQTEELSKLQDKYGKDLNGLNEQDDEEDDEDEEDEDDLSSDDSDAELITPSVDVAILKTLAKIRSKDPEVYQEGKQVFDEEEESLSTRLPTKTKSASTDKSKPILLKDYQRERLISDPTFSRPDSIPDASFSRPTHAEEELQLKEQVKAAFHSIQNDDEDSDEDVLIKRSKTVDETKREEEEYQKFLNSHLGAKAVKEALVEEEKFLNDYILNRGWIDRTHKRDRIPSYKEITGSHEADSDAEDDGIEEVQSLKKNKKSRDSIARKVADDLLLQNLDEQDIPDPGQFDDDDDEFEDKAEEFEHKYNFRFEEAEGSSLVTHSRNATSSIRKPTTIVSARQRARESAKEKKEQDKLARKEEVRRLKALKRKQVETKLAQLIEAAGQGTKGLDQIDLEGDWDEQEHDRKMREVYGDEYEQVDDDAFKPTWDDDIDIGDIEEVGDDEVGEYATGINGDEAEEYAGDEGEDEDDEEGEGSGKRSRRQAKRDSKKRKRDDEGFPIELLEAARAGGDEARQRLLDSMVDDYYALDHEDTIGDIRTRFKYAKVAPSTYNLTAEEILLATDAELNSFMSLRKLAPYRNDEGGVKAAKQKKRLKELRDAIRSRKWGDEVDDEGNVVSSSGAPQRKKQKKWSEENGRPKKKENGAEAAPGAEGESSGKKSKRAGKSERKRKQKAAAEAATAIGSVE